MKLFAFAAILSAAMLLPTFAQETQKDGKPMPHPAVRKISQQKRIGKGVKSGALTAGETSRLEKSEHSVNKETTAMRAANGGKLTAADKAKIQARQNNISNRITKDKTNDVTRQDGGK